MKKASLIFAIIFFFSCFTAFAQPTLSSSLTPPRVCNNTIFNYTPFSSTPGTTFVWSRALVPGISLPPSTGIDNISEVLTNTTDSIVTVVYSYTLTATSGTNVQDVTVQVYPGVRLTSPLSDTVCNGVPFTYIPTSAIIPPVYFTWIRDNQIGISDGVAIGTDAISNVLHDTLTSSVWVVYEYLLVSGTCMDTELLQVLVVQPHIAAIAGPSEVCIDSAITLTDSTLGGLWSCSNALASVSASGIVTGLLPGIDTVIYMVPDLCSSPHISKEITIASCTPAGIIRMPDVNELILYPNPSNGTLSIKTQCAGTLSVFTTDGREIEKYLLTGNENTITIGHNVQPGIYICRFKGSDGRSVTEKLVYEP